MWAEHTRHWSTRSADQEWDLKKLEPRETCLLCEEPLRLLAVYQCDHCSVCGSCALKLRGLQHDLQCCQCKAFSVFVIVVRHELAYQHKVLMSPQGRASACIPATLHALQRAGLLFVDSQEASKALNRLLIRCQLCKSKLEGSIHYTTIEELQEHLVNRRGKLDV
ncbi:MAG: hypothetical protein KVP17_000574 [Porospora cf. gigantea B]|uniref:uncharacterized protein n=1 Tax=Porospora cf. gigantea B TaxID=2853592 RepID=UPI003571EC9F|nr:MAG: hypothetical protein KVP17_000574 [Porospora cf. gigantea B]